MSILVDPPPSRQLIANAQVVLVSEGADAPTDVPVAAYSIALVLLMNVQGMVPSLQEGERLSGNARTCPALGKCSSSVSVRFGASLLLVPRCNVNLLCLCCLHGQLLRSLVGLSSMIVLACKYLGMPDLDLGSRFRGAFQASMHAYA